jgi:hypothetical protein
VGADDSGEAVDLDQLQPDGNVRDDLPTPEEIATQERYAGLARTREANRVGPRHPAHAFHQQWLKDHGRGTE